MKWLILLIILTTVYVVDDERRGNPFAPYTPPISESQRQFMIYTDWFNRNTRTYSGDSNNACIGNDPRCQGCY